MRHFALSPPLFLFQCPMDHETYVWYPQLTERLRALWEHNTPPQLYPQDRPITGRYTIQRYDNVTHTWRTHTMPAPLPGTGFADQEPVAVPQQAPGFTDRNPNTEGRGAVTPRVVDNRATNLAPATRRVCDQLAALAPGILQVGTNVWVTLQHIRLDRDLNVDFDNSWIGFETRGPDLFPEGVPVIDWEPTATHLNFARFSDFLLGGFPDALYGHRGAISLETFRNRWAELYTHIQDIVAQGATRVRYMIPLRGTINHNEGLIPPNINRFSFDSPFFLGIAEPGTQTWDRDQHNYSGALGNRILTMFPRNTRRPGEYPRHLVDYTLEGTRGGLPDGNVFLNFITEVEEDRERDYLTWYSHDTGEDLGSLVDLEPFPFTTTTPTNDVADADATTAGEHVRIIAEGVVVPSSGAVPDSESPTMTNADQALIDKHASKMTPDLLRNVGVWLENANKHVRQVVSSANSTAAVISSIKSAADSILLNPSKATGFLDELQKRVDDAKKSFEDPNRVTVEQLRERYARLKLAQWFEDGLQVAVAGSGVGFMLVTTWGPKRLRFKGIITPELGPFTIRVFPGLRPENGSIHAAKVAGTEPFVGATGHCHTNIQHLRGPGEFVNACPGNAFAAGSQKAPTLWWALSTVRPTVKVSEVLDKLFSMYAPDASPYSSIENFMEKSCKVCGATTCYRASHRAVSTCTECGNNPSDQVLFVVDRSLMAEHNGHYYTELTGKKLIEQRPIRVLAPSFQNDGTPTLCAVHLSAKIVADLAWYDGGRNYIGGSGSNMILRMNPYTFKGFMGPMSVAKLVTEHPYLKEFPPSAVTFLYDNGWDPQSILQIMPLYLDKTKCEGFLRGPEGTAGLWGAKGVWAEHHPEFRKALDEALGTPWTPPPYIERVFTPEEARWKKSEKSDLFGTW